MFVSHEHTQIKLFSKLATAEKLGGALNRFKFKCLQIYKGVYTNYLHQLKDYPGTHKPPLGKI